MTPVPPSSATSPLKKYALLGLAAFLLIAAYFIANGVEFPVAADKKYQGTDQNRRLIAIERNQIFPDDIILGNPTAGVTVIEYASFTCPHCAKFHTGEGKKLRDEYVLGPQPRIRYIFRDFPLDKAALKAAELARCDRSKRTAFTNLLFETQETWTKVSDEADLMQKLIAKGGAGGLSEEKVQACLSDPALEDVILKEQAHADRTFKIDSTPTLVINGTAYPGETSFDKLKKILDPLMDAAEQKAKEAVPSMTHK
jgi:protein-disulfide isomerase